MKTVVVMRKISDAKCHILQNGYLIGCLHCKRNEGVKKDSGQLPAIR